MDCQFACNPPICRDWGPDAHGNLCGAIRTMAKPVGRRSKPECRKIHRHGRLDHGDYSHIANLLRGLAEPSHQPFSKVVPKALGTPKYFHLSAKLDGPTPTAFPSAFARCASSDTERYSHLLERHCAMGPVVNSLWHPGNIYIKPSFLYRTIYLSLFKWTVWK